MTENDDGTVAAVIRKRNVLAVDLCDAHVEDPTSGDGAQSRGVARTQPMAAPNWRVKVQ